MTLTILDPRTGRPVTITVPSGQTEAGGASFDALAHILAIAATEANRMAEWERRVTGRNARVASSGPRKHSIEKGID